MVSRASYPRTHRREGDAMSQELPEVACPSCDARFTVIYHRTYEGEKPEYCPMCGAEIDYAECVDD